MNLDWKVNLDKLEIKHPSGITIKKSLDTNSEKEKWIVIQGNCDKIEFNYAVAFFEHEYSKKFFRYYQKENNLDMSKLIDITNDYVEKNGLAEYISLAQIKQYMTDNELFPIQTISTIRAAVYFYKKEKLEDTQKN